MKIPESLRQAIATWRQSSGLGDDAALLALARIIAPGAAVLRAAAGFPMIQFQDKNAPRGSEGPDLAGVRTILEEFARREGLRPAEAARRLSELLQEEARRLDRSGAGPEGEDQERAELSALALRGHASPAEQARLVQLLDRCERRRAGGAA